MSRSTRDRPRTGGDASHAGRYMPHIVLVAAGAAVLHFVAGAALLTPEPYHGGDNATYLALARGIVEQGRYIEAWDPAARAMTLYPPVFPIVLAAALLLGADGWVQLKLLSLAISALAVFTSVLWLRRVGGRTVAFTGAVLLALSPGVLQQAGYVLSEGLFWLFTMLALLCIDHVLPAPRYAGATADAPASTASSPQVWLVAAAACAALAALTRSAGLPLIVAAMLMLLVHRRWRDTALFAGITLLPMAAWALRGRFVGSRGYGSYLTMIDPYQPELGATTAGQFIRRMVANATSYTTEFAPSLLWGAEGTLRMGGAVLVAAAAVWLVMRLLQPRGAGVVEAWIVLYAGLLFIWPETWAGDRFVLVLAPAIVWLLGDMLMALRRRVPQWGGAAGAVTATLAVGLMTPAWAERLPAAAECRHAADTGDPFRCMPSGFPDFMRVARNAGGMLPQGSVVISRKPTLFYTESGLRSVMYPLSPDPEKFFATADSTGARYVVLDALSPLAEMYLHPVVAATPGRFCVEKAASHSDAVLLRIFPVPRLGARGPDESGYVSMPDCAALR